MPEKGIFCKLSFSWPEFSRLIMSGLLQASAGGWSPGQGTSNKSAKAVTEAEGSEDLAIFAFVVMTTDYQDLMSNRVTICSVLNFELQSHLRRCCFIEGQTL